MFNGDVLNIFILVRGFGIIGGGAVLFSASALAGSQTILPLLGETFVIRNFVRISRTLHNKGLGAAATAIGGGAAVTRAMCSPPFCT